MARRRERGPSVRVVPAGAGRRRLLVDGLEASVVDDTDPTHLDFPYMRWIADVLDVGWRAGEPLRAVHVGAGACVLARYLTATRPGSDSEAYDVDTGVTIATSSPSSSAPSSSRPSARRSGSVSQPPARPRRRGPGAAGGSERPRRACQRSERSRS